MFRLQGPVRLNGDGSLLFAVAGLCSMRWCGSKHDMQLIKSILQGNVCWAQFQFNNTRVLGVCVCAPWHECVHRLRGVCTWTTQHKRTRTLGLLAKRFWNEVIKRKCFPLKWLLWSFEIGENRNLYPISDDRLDDCGYLAPLVFKL